LRANNCEMEDSSQHPSTITLLPALLQRIFFTSAQKSRFGLIMIGFFLAGLQLY